MRISLGLLVASLLVVSTQTVAAMSESEIRHTISNKRVLLETRFGIEFPLFYKANGTVTGDGTGFGIGSFVAPKETGKWWLKKHKLCQQFPTWNNGEMRCFALENLGNNTFKWYQDNGNSGRAKIH